MFINLQQNVSATNMAGESVCEKIKMKIRILLEIDRRNCDSAVCIKYYGSFYGWVVSLDPEDASNKHFSKNCLFAKITTVITEIHKYSASYLYSIFPVVGSKVTHLSFHFLSCLKKYNTISKQ